jgi:hypothetical protein
MYLALEQPWRRAVGEAAAPVADAGTATAEPPGKKPGKKRRGRPVAGRGEVEAGEGELEETAPAIELSAADRKLAWRGAEVVLPPAQHDFSKEDAGRSLNDDEIAGAVRDQSRPIIDCMVSAAAGTDLRATVTVRMLVDGKGTVTRHRIQAPQYLFDHGMASCVARALDRLRFPATGAPTLVTAPFDLG